MQIGFFLPKVFQGGNLLEICFKMSTNTIPQKIHLQHLGEKNEFSTFSTLALEIKRPFSLSDMVWISPKGQWMESAWNFTLDHPTFNCIKCQFDTTMVRWHFVSHPKNHVSVICDVTKGPMTKMKAIYGIYRTFYSRPTWSWLVIMTQFGHNDQNKNFCQMSVKLENFHYYFCNSCKLSLYHFN